MYHHALHIVEEAEKAAGAGQSFEQILVVLRKLSLDEFGQLFITMPNADFPALSRILPAMASETVQMNWTGGSGETLLKLTTAFVRQAEDNFIRYNGRSLNEATIMDFGCGYGRILRMMYYFSDPSRIWGIDAWDRSLALCRDAGLPGNFVLSQNMPTTLPVGETKFDFGFAFSVFSHLSQKASEACLKAIRNHMAPGALFVATIRPVEYWPFHDLTRKMNVAQRMQEMHHQSGFAYLPHNGPEGETYGDSSIRMDYFKSLDGWQFMGHDWSLIDPYQVSIVLRAA